MRTGIEIRRAESPLTQEEFQKQLDARKMTVDDMKAQLKRDLSITKLFNKEITSHISISDKDVTDFYNSNKAASIFRSAGAPGADSGVADARRERAQSEKRQGAERRAGAQEDGHAGGAAQAGRGFRDAGPELLRRPTTAPTERPGFVPESALEKANTEIRAVIQTAPAGR